LLKEISKKVYGKAVAQFVSGKRKLFARERGGMSFSHRIGECCPL